MICNIDTIFQLPQSALVAWCSDKMEHKETIIIIMLQLDEMVVP